MSVKWFMNKWPLQKPAPKAVMKEETTTRHMSFCDVDELMSDEVVTKVQFPAEAPKSKKKFAAPAAPEFYPSTTIDNTIEELHMDVKPNQIEELAKEDPAKQETNSQKTHTAMSVSEKCPAATAQSHVHEVIHYTPQSATRMPVAPPPPSSDVPYVERRSNIVLNDKSGRKTIPVSQFDGIINRTREKKAAPPPPPFSTSVLAVSHESKTLPAAAARKASASNPKETALVKEIFPLNDPVSVRQQNFADDNDELKHAAIMHEYETLKAKFDLWQTLQEQNRYSLEARQLHVDIIYQHDSLMKKLQQASDIALPPGKSRPTIAPDTFTPWRADNAPKLPSTQNTKISRNSENKRRPAALPSRWAPNSSKYSPSPTTSASGEDSDQSRHGYRQTQAITTGLSREAYKRQLSSNSDEKAFALQRIIEEANELKRKEQELRASSRCSTTKSLVIPVSTSRNMDEGRAVAMSYTFPKHSHIRDTSDGNNNSISAALQSMPQNASGSQSSIVKSSAVLLAHLSNSTPPQHIRSKTYVNGTRMNIHSTTSSPRLHRENENQEDTQKHLSFDEFMYKPLLFENVKDSLTVPRINPEHSRPFSSKGLLECKVPGKLSHLKEGKRWTTPSEFNGENHEKNSSPQTPDSESNIRKVKEAVRLQTLSPKSASTLLLQQNGGKLWQIKDAPNASKQSDVPTQKDDDVKMLKISRVAIRNGNDDAFRDEVTNNISIMFNEKIALKKIKAPIEKNGIVLGKVVDETSSTSFEPSSSSPSLRPAPTPPPLPPPAKPPLPPPLLPPSSLTRPTSSSLRISTNSTSCFHPPSSISKQDLERQKLKLKPTIMVGGSVTTKDVRDNLMAEIRDAGGIRALRKTGLCAR